MPSPHIKFKHPPHNQHATKRGFNGKELVDEMEGDGNAYDFGARLYNSRLGRWMSKDPLANKYFGYSPYNFALNSPILLIDPDGKVVELYEKNGNKVATISEKGLIIEKGMENAAILLSYLEAKKYLEEKSGTDIFKIVERNSRVLKIEEAENVNGLGSFKHSKARFNYKDKNKNDKVEGDEILDNPIYQDDKVIGTIKWETNLGFKDGEGNLHSPALLLAHEIIHSIHFISDLYKYLKNTYTKSDKFDDEEEKVTNDEVNEISKKMAELSSDPYKLHEDGGNGTTLKRNSHRLKSTFKTESTSSNKWLSRLNPKN
jgi:RHS repeat-associated protein